MSTINDADLDEVLRRAYPQGYALLRLEHGAELLNHGARHLIGSPHLALEVLGPQGVGKLGRALLALSQRHTAQAERLLELAQADAEAPGAHASTNPKPHSRRPAPPKDPD
jgi:hypothetical protein